MKITGENLGCNTCIAGCSSECQSPEYVKREKDSSALECFCKDKCSKNILKKFITKVKKSQFPQSSNIKFEKRNFLKGGQNANR